MGDTLCAICNGRKPTHRAKYCGKKCAKASKALWKKNNPESVKESAKRWYLKNRLKAQEEYARWCEANPTIAKGRVIPKRIAKKKRIKE